MKLLVTGADGFVGRWLVRQARADGHDVIAAVMPGTGGPPEWADPAVGRVVEVVHADIREEADLARLAATGPEAVAHLAAVASSAAAREDPEGAMQVNAIATVSLIGALGDAGCRSRFLFVSSGEVYGPGHDRPIAETTPMNPTSNYAATKAAAEPAVLDLGPANGLEVMIARPFTHTGPGQATNYVLPALASRLIEARRSGETAIRTGNLRPVRDFLDVRDVVRAYLLLLEKGVSGEVYNVATGIGQPLSDCFRRLAEIVGVNATAAPDAALLRPGDIPVLIGDAMKIRQATGWAPTIPFDRTLQDLVDAQAH